MHCTVRSIEGDAYRVLCVCRTTVDKETGTGDATVTSCCHLRRRTSSQQLQRRRYTTVGQEAPVPSDRGLTTPDTVAPPLPVSYRTRV